MAWIGGSASLWVNEREREQGIEWEVIEGKWKGREKMGDLEKGW